MVPNADRLGLVADPRGAAVGAEGVVPGLWAVGGVLRPRDFEATAVPELARQALTGRDGFSALPGEPANGSTYESTGPSARQTSSAHRRFPPNHGNGAFCRFVSVTGLSP